MWCWTTKHSIFSYNKHGNRHSHSCAFRCPDLSHHSSLRNEAQAYTCIYRFLWTRLPLRRTNTACLGKLFALFMFFFSRTIYFHTPWKELASWTNPQPQMLLLNACAMSVNTRICMFRGQNMSVHTQRLCTTIYLRMFMHVICMWYIYIYIYIYIKSSRAYIVHMRVFVFMYTHINFHHSLDTSMSTHFQFWWVHVYK
jgi:hypothetical protein